MSEINDIIVKIKNEQAGPIYEKRIEFLKKSGMETSIIETGIEKAANVIKKGTKSFVIYGEPQSGKTEVMIALTCKLVDLGFRTIFVVMNDNTELENQNYIRFQSATQLNPAPLRDFQLADLEKSQLKQDRVRIIFCRKNSKNLQNLIENCRYMRNRVVIDDEADFATVDANINKLNKDATAINQGVGKLGNLNDDGVYIGVTATPGRLDLNNTFRNNAKEWVYLDSHKAYVGRSFFFPMTESPKYNLMLMPDEGDSPKHLKEAILRYLLRAADLNLDAENDEYKCYSMLIHTAGKINDHIEDKKIVDKVIEHLNDPLGTGLKLTESLMKEAQKLYPDQNKREAILQFVLKNIGKNQVVVINNKNDRANVDRACNPKVLFTFAIGGNIVSRGLTFKNLLSFFFSRNVKGKLQQNTYIQRARMFGIRPYYSHFELTIPKSLYENWADCFQDHELSVRLGKSGNLVHIERSTNRAADPASIDKQHVVVGRGEREVGGIFVLTPEINDYLLNASGSPVDSIRSLINKKLLDETHFAPEILAYIEETSQNVHNDCSMVFRFPGDQPFIQDIEQYSDADEDTITRKRGGIIQGLIRKRPMYEDKMHYILPIRNAKGQARFLYRQALGQNILQNVK